MISSTDEPGLREDEDDGVLNWRFEQLCALGYDDAQAFILARSDLELSLLRKMIGRGCSLELAAKIAL